MKKNLTICLVLAFTASHAQFQAQRIYSTFDHLSLSKADTFNNGADLSGGVNHFGRHFINTYDTIWGSWDGWTLSNMTDDSSRGYTNQFSAKPGHGLSYTDNYMLAYQNASIRLEEPTELSGAYICNSTYVYFDLLEGSAFSKKFGGSTGNDPDYLSLTAYSYLNSSIVDSATIFLADYRFTDNQHDYILDDWTYFDFNGQEEDVLADSLVFVLSSTDNGQWGMNTPAYFCLDDFNAITNTFKGSGIQTNLAEDTFYNGHDHAGGFVIEYLFFPNNYDENWQSWDGWATSNKQDFVSTGYENQYSSIATFMPKKLNYFLTSYGQENEIRAPYFNENENWIFKTQSPAPWPVTFGFTNSTYAYYDMINGSAFSKKFGGLDGNNPDYFRIVLSFLNHLNETIGTDTVYLADFRSSDNAKDYILSDWKYMELSEALNGETAHKIKFKLESSDTGSWGMNTPAYFCMNLNFDFGSKAEMVKQQYALKLFPNPASNMVHIESQSKVKLVEMYTVSGKRVLSGSGTSIDISALSKGMYILHITTEKGMNTHKLLVQ